MSPRSTRTELDDDSLLRIFSKVGCARELARFAVVCKRWRDLSCAVSYISFDLEAATRKELRAKEGIISSALCRASSRAPGNLKHLCISLACEEEAAEVHGHWLLLWTTSLTKLELLTYSPEWGPAVWNSIMRMKALEELTIEGDFCTEKHFLLPQVLENGLQMTRLRRCIISCNIGMLETIFATCPALTEISVHVVASEDNLAKALRVASTSLQIFELGLDIRDGFEITVHAPSLTTLELLTGPTTIYFESAQSLRKLSVESSYKLYSPPENLQELNLSGAQDLQRLPKMLMLTPMITDLCLKGSTLAREVRLDTFASLVNLKNIHLASPMISKLRPGERRFEALNVHIWPTSYSPPKIDMLKALIEVHKVQSLVVHCMHMLDCQTKTIQKHYHEDWRFLFELMYFYPDRVRLVR